MDEIKKAARGSGSDIEQTIGVRGPQKPPDHGDAVLHIDKISQLTTIAIAWVMRFKEGDGPTRRNDRIYLAGDGLHVAFVSLVRAIHIEEFETGPLRRAWLAAHNIIDYPTINDMFAPTISVERSQPSQSDGALIIAET